MNDTLNLIKVRQDKAAEARQTDAQKRAEIARTRAEAAEPLFAGFRDVRSQLVRVSVLQLIWPEDYESRDDRATALVADILGDRERPYGIKFRIPGGYRRFQVEIADDGSPSFVVIRESPSGKPYVATYRSSDEWLEAFYGTMATLLEL